MARWTVLTLVAVVLIVVGVGWVTRSHGDSGFLEFQTPTAQSIPAAIALSSDGAVWFTLESSDALGVLRDGVIREIPRGGESLEALGLAADTSGGVWFTDIPGQSIKHLSSEGDLDAVQVPGPLAQLGRLAVAPDGAVWFADSWGNSVTRLADGHMTPHLAAESNAAPFGVAVDVHGSVWATLQIANKIMRIDPDGSVTELDLPSHNATPTDIAVDTAGDVWFTELRGNKIGHLTGGRVDEISVQTEAPGLTSIAVAPDGSVWFTELRRHSVARLQKGTISEFALPRDDARPFSVAISGAGDVWYTDLGGKVGKLPATRARSTELDFGRIFAWLLG